MSEIGCDKNTGKDDEKPKSEWPQKELKFPLGNLDFCAKFYSFEQMP